MSISISQQTQGKYRNKNHRKEKNQKQTGGPKTRHEERGRIHLSKSLPSLRDVSPTCSQSESALAVFHLDP
jgi:hypothetical protein